MNTLEIGCKAYFDSFDGLIPAKVIDIRGTDGMASLEQTVTLKLTANRRAYTRGELIETTGLHAVPRGSVHVRSGQYRIRAYRVKAQYSA